MNDLSRIYYYEYNAMEGSLEFKRILKHVPNTKYEYIIPQSTTGEVADLTLLLDAEVILIIDPGIIASGIYPILSILDPYNNEYDAHSKILGYIIKDNSLKNNVAIEFNKRFDSLYKSMRDIEMLRENTVSTVLTAGDIKKDEYASSLDMMRWIPKYTKVLNDMVGIHETIDSRLHSTSEGNDFSKQLKDSRSEREKLISKASNIVNHLEALNKIEEGKISQHRDTVMNNYRNIAAINMLLYNINTTKIHSAEILNLLDCPNCYISYIESLDAKEEKYFAELKGIVSKCNKEDDIS